MDLVPTVESDSFFHQDLLQWQELNCTSHFTQFVAAVSPFVQSLAQVLFHKGKIVELLLEHLRVKDSLALRPLLQCVSPLPLFFECSEFLVQLQFDWDTCARPKTTFFALSP